MQACLPVIPCSAEELARLPPVKPGLQPGQGLKTLRDDIRGLLGILCVGAKNISCAAMFHPGGGGGGTLEPSVPASWRVRKAAAPQKQPKPTELPVPPLRSAAPRPLPTHFCGLKQVQGKAGVVKRGLQAAHSLHLKPGAV